MDYVKKLLFALLSLIALYFLINQSQSFMGGYSALLSVDATQLLGLLLLALYTSFFSLLTIFFLTFSNSWKFTLPFSVVVFILGEALSGDLIIGGGFALATLISYPLLRARLLTYLTFHPIPVFTPSIKTLAHMMVIVLAISYFVRVDTQISQHGFQIPDSLVDTALQFSSLPSQTSTPETPKATPTTPTLPQISPQQLALLKSHPELLKQYGLDPSILDQINTPSKPTPHTSSPSPTLNIKSLVKNQLQSMVKPYTGMIAPLLALLFFLTLYSLLSITNLVVYPLILGIFYLLEQTGFVHFEKEMREVKKLVI